MSKIGDYSPISSMGTGTVFLYLRGETRRFGVVTFNGVGDRAPETATWVLEDGIRGEHCPPFY